MRRVLHLPLTIVAMAEASAEVNRIRREIRDGLGVDTIEVRQSLDTALQIRRRLADNRIVAMLMDRHLGRDRVEVTLLGRPAWFLRTPALMGYLTGAPLMPCFIERIRRPAASTFRRRADRRLDRPCRATRRFAGGAAVRRPARARASAGIPSTGISSTATGTRSGTRTKASPDRSHGVIRGLRG